MNKEMDKKLQPQRSVQTQRSMGQKEMHSMGTAIRPVERHGMDAIKFFLYDPKEGRILGRTPMSWVLITIFYTIYYSLLAGFWALCFFIFYRTTIDEREPRWNGKDWNGSGRMGKSPALIGQSPALGVRPGQSNAHIESSMITYNYQQEKDDKENKIAGFGGWVKRTEEFLEKYKDCKDNKLFCGEELGDCAKGKFGWDEGKPCILLKLNKIYGLQHAYYNQTWNSTEPGYISYDKKDFPEEVVNYLNDTEVDEKDKNQVWVNCKGENAADQENMGPLTYYPTARGFHDKHNMFNWKTKDAGYRSPLVAVKFEKPKKGVFIHVECRAWAANIGYDHMDRIGKAHFELMIYDSDYNPQSVGKTTA